MSQSELLRWTRNGVLRFSWNKAESFEKLVLTPALREKILIRLDQFNKGEKHFHRLELPWRFGIYFFGASGSGKTAASRGIARHLEWDHFSIPAHEILDAHLFEHALSSAISQPKRVVVLEDVDLMIKRMEPEVFFTLLDHALERAEGSFWIATSRNSENTPKIQLIRPGRFDETIRFELPNLSLRREFFGQLLGIEPTSVEPALIEPTSGEPSSPDQPNQYDHHDQHNKTNGELSGQSDIQPELIPSTSGSNRQSWLTEWSEMSEGMSFAHFEELRQIWVRLELEQRVNEEIYTAVRTYIEDQLIAGDRWGGISDQTQRLEERVRHIDSRVLMAALDMTDVFRALIEKTIGDAAAQASQSQTESTE